MAPALEGAFWAAACLVVYSYAGYPLLLAALARFRARPTVAKDPALTPTVAVVVVVNNEGRRIEAKIRNCLELDYPGDRLTVVVVSDGSTDDTEDRVRAFAGRGVELVALAGPPAGKARALSRVVPELDATVVLFGDARQELEPQALRELVANLADPTVGAVSGELHIRVPDGAPAGEGVGFYWKYEKAIRRLESRYDSVIGVTGAIYALRRELFRPIDERMILDDVAIPMTVARAGQRVLFEPLARAWDWAATDSRTELRRKIRTLAGNYQLVWLEPWLLSPAHNRLWWELCSHKLTRLAVPWCLLAMLALSVALAATGNPLYQLLLVAQGAFYALALLGGVATRGGVKSRFLSVPYAFAMLNAAAALSLIAFLTGTQSAAWKRSQIGEPGPN